MQTVTDDDLLYVIISKSKSVGTHANDKIANGHNYETFVCSVCVWLQNVRIVIATTTTTTTTTIIYYFNEWVCTTHIFIWKDLCYEHATECGFVAVVIYSIYCMRCAQSNNDLNMIFKLIYIHAYCFCKQMIII